MKPIMLATDGSPSAEAATQEAIGLAKSLGAPLLVACVAYETTPFYAYYGYAELMAEMKTAQKENVKKVFAAVKEQASAASVECDTVALDGLPGEQICEAARSHNARLVVIGAHGWGRVGRMIHGSVSTYVLHHAGTPVLVVPGDAPGGEARV